MPQVSVTINADAVAWYGAIVSTIGFVLGGYLAWRDRPRISITIQPDVRLMNVPPYDPNKTYINITVRNRGRRPVKISTAYLKLHDDAGYFLVSDSLYQHVERVLTEENPRTNFFVEQNLIDPTKIEYALVIDETGRTSIKYHRRGAWLRRKRDQIASLMPRS